MSGISAENLARLTSASKAQLSAAVLAGLETSSQIEGDQEMYRAASRVIAARIRMAIEGALR